MGTQADSWAEDTMGFHDLRDSHDLRVRWVTFAGGQAAYVGLCENLTVPPLLSQTSTVPFAFCLGSEACLLVGARSPNRYTQRGVDIHTTHNDKASADALGNGFKEIKIGGGPWDELPIGGENHPSRPNYLTQLSVLVLDWTYGVHTRIPPLPQLKELGL